MSRRNGDRSRFQINRKRKLRHRQRVRTLLASLVDSGKAAAAVPDRHGSAAEPGERVEPV
jgi:hypothetical protein